MSAESNILKLQPELNLALARLNFDFSLFKVDAPAEYEPLGASLSKYRRSSAEDGTQHVTARRLGALFKDIVPRIPTLIKCYGRRVSEISQVESANPKGSKKYGSFADFVGADATTIWAAATSGDEAIAVHLLACMLSRMFSAEEATSIWVELVEKRREEIERDYGQGSHHPQSLAARQEISRSQLRHWDASARSWIQTADEEKVLQQKRLKLFAENIDEPVNDQRLVYQSVISAWKDAMTAMECLLKGMPQMIQDGAVLLGLSAWHIYPDMVVMKRQETVETKFQDSLVPIGGLLTIPAERVSEQDGSGIRWSLSLAHLRFYGGPVQISRSSGAEHDRITFENLGVAVLGSVTAGWGYDQVSELEGVAKFFTEMWDSFTKKIQESSIVYQFLRCDSGWMSYLVNASRRFLGSAATGDNYITGLARLGQRRGRILGHKRNHPPSVFGLRRPQTRLQLLRNEENRITALRRIALECGLDNLPEGAVLIRYYHLPPIEQSFQGHYEYASAVPHTRYTSSKGIKSSLYPEEKGYSRWIGFPRCDSDTSVSGWGVPGDGNADVAIDGEENQEDNRDKRRMPFRLQVQRATAFQWCNAPKQFSLDDDGNFLQRQNVTFGLLCGDPRTAAIYVRAKQPICQEMNEAKQWRFQLGEITKGFEDNSFTEIYPDDLVKFLTNLGPTSGSADAKKEAKPDMLMPRLSYYPSLMAFVAAGRVYKPLANATVSLEVLYRPLHTALWIPNISIHYQSSSNAKFPGYRAYHLTREQVFACIAMFESGNVNLDPARLRKVMALSSGNSIYAVKPLLDDPSITHSYHEVRRVVGNIGRPGIGMLYPPENLQISALELGDWRCVYHTAFDGKVEDNFGATSMHLTFTGYEERVGIDGLQDAQVYLLESVISVRDGGKWKADLDILGTLESGGHLKRFRRRSECIHGGEPSHQDGAGVIKLTSIDNWDELLDSPLGAGVVRANGNWIARLAATVTALQKGHPVCVIEGDACWKC
ncbi:hypothetical protein DM02DRAFT_562852, partial [Periconia macrospinosa]